MQKMAYKKAGLKYYNPNRLVLKTLTIHKMAFVSNIQALKDK